MKSFITNWKTSVGGLLAGGPAILCQMFHICSVGHLGGGDWLGLISGIGAVWMGLLAKDHNVTGGSVQQ